MTRGEETTEAAGALDDLMELIFGKYSVVFPDEPMGTPWVAAVETAGFYEVTES